MTSNKSYRKRYWRLVISFFRPNKLKLSALILVLFGVIGLQLYNPFVLRMFIDGATEGRSETYLIYCALVFIGISILQQLLTLIVTYTGEVIGWKATNSLRLQLARHYLSLDTETQNKFTSGEIVERIDGDISILQNFFSHLFIKLLANFLIIIGVLIILFSVNWRIGLSLSCFTLLAFFAIDKIRMLAEPFWKQAREINSRFFGFLSSIFEGKEDIRSNGGSGYFLKKFHYILRSWLPVLRKAQLLGYSMWMTTIFVLAVGTSIVLGIGGIQFLDGALTIGTLFMIFQFLDLLIHPIEKIREQVDDLQKANASISRVLEMLNTSSKIKTGEITNIGPGSLRVEFDRVSFHYDPASPILRSIQFQIDHKKKVGLVGRTGSGKSTIARLLMRLYEPASGMIKINGSDIRLFNLTELRKRIGFVSQDVKLLQSTLRDNITLYDSSISDDQLLRIIEETGLREWYDSLPHGLDTQILSHDFDVSAGEAQLISLLRVFLNDPGIVIFDEASSRLDNNTEKMIERAVHRLLSERTAIIIAHRLSTLEIADEIIVLDEGSIVEYGPRSKLYADHASSFFRNLQNVEMGGK
ncbi:ABC transporter ATP-binding protein [Xylanibacillus composti]|uniref:Helicase n=1 Tax=Xylanibacillus composti TaxID=1572762 RepID=A0A8J4H1D9_9BACL|nr:ABC transporter ATP-binding protein [Xylanibacillus composti]MDT9723915.1 ABC transporter ATP-binding protein [Xylanibacillus composti]GIQ67795.1 helicase [Xylanibacillus composti]